MADLETNSYRHQIALVTQEPQLFSTTIANNIAYGVDGTVPQVCLYSVHGLTFIYLIFLLLAGSFGSH